MKKHNLDDMVGGWFIGHFEPTLLKTDDFEVAVKIYKKGDYEENHFHKIATEYTLILDGEVIMSGENYSSGDIIIIKPNESTDFRALTDVKTVVVKTPSVANDKYLK
jgi:quercetin dioxygenase-like cupin family protein